MTFNSGPVCDVTSTRCSVLPGQEQGDACRRAAGPEFGAQTDQRVEHRPIVVEVTDADLGRGAHAVGFVGGEQHPPNDRACELDADAVTAADPFHRHGFPRVARAGSAHGMADEANCTS